MNENAKSNWLCPLWELADRVTEALRGSVGNLEHDPPPPPERLQEATATLCDPEASTAAVADACLVLEDALAAPGLEIVTTEALSGVNKAVLVTLSNEVSAVWKPVRKDPVHVRRERAAYLLDKRLGHLARVPPVVLRKLGKEKGALVWFIPGARPAFRDPRSAFVLRSPERDNYYRLALIDNLVGNLDRHSGNWVLNEEGIVFPIDHGLAFPEHNGQQWFRAYDFSLSVDLKPEHGERLRQLSGEALRDELDPLIGAAAVEALVERVEAILNLGYTYDWQRMRYKTERRRFLESTGLDAGRPEHRIDLSDVARYDELLRHIEVHRYYLGQTTDQEVELAEAAASWFDNVYRPVIVAIQESGLFKEFPTRKLTDLYLWVTYHRERHLEEHGEMPTDHSIAEALASRYSERPVVGPLKTLMRSIKAAWAAASETPEPPAAANG